jgi:hypothetical protein
MSERAPRKVVIRGEEPTTPAEPKPEVSETYSVNAKCSNCEWEGDAEIPKGFPIKKGECLDVLYLCPDCGCKTLVRCDKLQTVTAPLVPNSLQEYVERIMRENEDIQRYPTLPQIGQPYTPPPQPVWAPNPSWIGDPPNYWRGTYGNWNTTSGSGSSSSSSSSSSGSSESSSSYGRSNSTGARAAFDKAILSELPEDSQKRWEEHAKQARAHSIMGLYDQCAISMNTVKSALGLHTL